MLYFSMRTCLNININIESDGLYKCICIEIRKYSVTEGNRGHHHKNIFQTKLRFIKLYLD